MSVDPQLDGWFPFRIVARASEPSVLWCHAGDARFTEPFFEQTVQRCLRMPFNQLFAAATSIDTLKRRADEHPGIAPTAFIFHVSRCGSTLFAQLAAALPHTIVVSEAGSVDQVMRSGRDDDTRIAWLRAVVAALAQPRRGDEQHLFVKFDAWHVTDLELVRRAFPAVPCVFLYRDPADVVASQVRMPGLHMVPGMMGLSIPGMDLETALRLPREEYVARMLAPLYASALPLAAAGELLLMHYDELPGRAISLLLEWCGLQRGEDVLALLNAVAARDAKTPSLPFDPSDGGARKAPTDAMRDASERFIGRAYEQLELLRMNPPPRVRQLTLQ